MNKNELKKVLKPLIKECIKEVLLEEKGTLSHIISEVKGGLSAAVEPVTDQSEVKIFKNDKKTRNKKQFFEQKKKQILDAIGKDAYNGVNIFEGTTPTEAPISEGQARGPLSDVSPSDPGVDISNLFGAKAFMMNKKMMEKK